MKNDFEKFAISNGIGSARLDQYRANVTNQYGGYINPVILEERQLNVVPMDVFSRLQMDRIIFFGSEVNSDTANVVNAQLLYLNSIGDEDIKMYINSPGGVIYDGLSIVDTMNFITPDVSTYCMGMAASMASVLLACGEKDKRYILPHSRVLIHQPMGGMRGQATDMEIEVAEIKKLKNELYQILSERTGQPYEKIFEDCERDHWLTAQEALEYGIIDHVINTRK